MTVAQIIAQVAREVGMTPADILGRSRVHTIAAARQEAMLRAREMTSQSLPQIGRSFGRDHKTVLHGCRAAERRRRAAVLARNAEARRLTAAATLHEIETMGSMQ